MYFDNVCSRSDQFIRNYICKFEGDFNYLVNFLLVQFILKGILLYFFSRSDQFIKDFSCKFEGDFNFLVNFYKGISFSPGWTCIAYPVGVQLFLLMFCFGLEDVYWTSKTYNYGLSMFLLQMLYPPKADE